MDWNVEIGTNLWAFPKGGVRRTGEAGPDSAVWTSKYGSVVASGYDISTTDGVNEAGLVANLLWLAESEYPPPTVGTGPRCRSRCGRSTCSTTSPRWARPSPR